jgi:arginase
MMRAHKEAQMSLMLLGYACGSGAGDAGCADGPVKLYESDLIAALQKHHITAEWLLPLLKPIAANNNDKYAVIAEINARLAQSIEKLVKNNQAFVTFGGDHTCAIGTWGGASNALWEKGDIGLIWVDAHLDSHTPATTPSGNIHGMPAAVLLGHGKDLLTRIIDSPPTIKPENMCFIGVRSFEAGEHELLKNLNVKIFYMDDVKQHGLDKIMAEAKAIVSKNTIGFGISIDLDAIDPLEAPGVGSPASDGLHGQELADALQKHISASTNFIGAEITEFNPHRDVNNQTLKSILQLVASLFS